MDDTIELNDEIRKKELHENQLKHQLMREQSKAKYQKRRADPEYRARTRRLCDKGGIIEHFYPDTKEMTAEEFYELIDVLDSDEQVKRSWSQKIKEIMCRRETVKT